MMKGIQAAFRSSRFFREIALLGLGALLLGASPASGQTLFSQTFNNSTAGAETISAFSSSWFAYQGATALDVSTTAAQGDTVAIANGAGNPSTSNGYLSISGSANTGQAYGVFTTLTSPITIPTGSAITWAMGNSKSTTTVRLLIQIGGTGTPGSGTWYAASTALSDAATHTLSTFESGTTDVAQSVNFTTLASAWDTFTLTPGSQMILGSTATSDLASSTITSIGFYISNSDGAVNRLDNLVVTAAPEPSAAALLGLGALGLGGVLFRRRAWDC